MISNLTITGFRAFRELRVDPLTRVNLFVGKNNAGKTSILEAVELVVSGTIGALPRILFRRGEEILPSEEEHGTELDPAHLFYGRSLHVGNRFSIIGGGKKTREVGCRVLVEEPDALFPSLTLVFGSHADPDLKFIRLSPENGIPFMTPTRRYPGSLAASDPPVNFLGTEPAQASRLGQLWDSLVLTPEEQGVVESLRIIEPDLERIAFLSENRGSLSSILLKLAESEQRLPLGSFGDGSKRLLALSLNLLSARKGFLLVDEIDTGLHHSVMIDMWKLVIETAKRLDVQVFATTHSLDCVHALAWVQEQNPDLAAEVTLHRIEKDAPATIVYNMDEIAIAERGQIEVR
jgi:energy-coupling factor transporter ATP-binding protein EcfA2